MFGKHNGTGQSYEIMVIGVGMVYSSTQ